MQALFIYCSICDVLSFFDSAQTAHSNQGHKYEKHVDEQTKKQSNKAENKEINTLNK